MPALIRTDRPAAPATGPRSRRTRVAAQAADRLRRQPYSALRRVDCAYRAGRLVLCGCLPSYYLKQVAQEAVAGLEGVEQVVNRIEVVRPNDGRAAGIESC